jgi:hypothetical protein
MMEDHTHGPDGRVIISGPSPETAEAEAVEEVAEAEVQIAKIQGETAIQLAKIEAKADEAHDETEVESLRAEIKGMKEILDRLAGGGDPEPEPSPEPAAPVVVVDDAPAAPEVPEPPDAEPEHHSAPKRSKGLGMW